MTFQKLDLFLSSLEDVVFCFLEYWMMEKVQNPSNSECYMPSSEPFRIYCFTSIAQLVQLLPSLLVGTGFIHWQQFSHVNSLFSKYVFTTLILYRFYFSSLNLYDDL
jgi:hypothetical protein